MGPPVTMGIYGLCINNCRRLFQAQYPGHQFLCVRFGDAHGFGGGHRDIAPYAGATFQDILDQLVRCTILSGVFFCNFLIGRADFFAVHFMTGRAALNVGQRLLVSGMGGSQGKTTEERGQKQGEVFHGGLSGLKKWG